MRKLLVLLLLAGIVGVVGWKYITTEAKEKQARRRGGGVVAVETALIGRADLGDRATFTGSIRANERYDAAPKISGIIRRVNFDVGDIVEKGDIIAVLDDDEHLLTVEQAEAKLQVAIATANDAEAQLAITRRDHDRNSTLHSQRVISSQDLDKIDATLTSQEGKLETARAQVKLAEAELKSAEVRLGYTRVVADWDGSDQERVIGQRYRDAGNLVSTTTPIVSVLDIKSVKAIISVSEKEFPRIQIGDSVNVTTDAFPGRTFKGRVERIPQELGVLSREADIEIAIENRERTLKPGMFIRADIEFQHRDSAVAAPLAAVVRRDDGRRGVYLVNDSRDKVVFHAVAEGIVDGPLVELINAGDLLDREVVVLGQHLLKDGMNIRVADAVSYGAPAGKGEKGKPGQPANDGKNGVAPAPAGGA